MKPILIYCYDAYCGWCYGFSPVIKKIAAHYNNQLDIEVLSGGMMIGESKMPIEKIGPYIQSAYKRVEELTGIQFGEDFLWHTANPDKSLFGESTRAFSHGCIRLAEPKKLAQYLLRNDAAWDSLKITNAMNAGKEQYVTLKQTIPVFIGYFTAWVDRAGKLNFRDDIYGHDKKMKARLFKKQIIK